MLITRVIIPHVPAIPHILHQSITFRLTFARKDKSPLKFLLQNSYETNRKNRKETTNKYILAPGPCELSAVSITSSQTDELCLQCLRRSSNATVWAFIRSLECDIFKR